jgi:hypothetical protein
LIIKKKDINSIFPTIIKIIKVILELVNKLAKSILDMPKSSEFVVLVKVKIDILNEFSKFIAFKDKSTDKIKRLKKNEIKIKKEFLVFSLSIFLLELKIFWFITLLGLINFSISEEVVFTKI